MNCDPIDQKAPADSGFKKKKHNRKANNSRYNDCRINTYFKCSIFSSLSEKNITLLERRVKKAVDSVFLDFLDALMQNTFQVNLCY